MSIKVAYVKEQGQNMILVPLDRSFGYTTQQQRLETLDDIQRRAERAGLAGSVALIWPTDSGTRVLGPGPWHPFLTSLDMSDVVGSLNKILY